MRIDVLTLFPQMILSPLEYSLIGRARQRGLVDLRVHNIRDYAIDKHKVTDDTPYGGGTGMVLLVEPLYRAIKAIDPDGRAKKIIFDAAGQTFDQQQAKKLMLEEWLLLICGHYKGVDERIKQLFELTEVSIGDYVLTGGEIPALVVIDAVVRLLPGVIKEIDSAQTDSYFEGLLGYPEYTRPREFMGLRVPDVLLSGDHEAIRRWRLLQSLRKTMERRPDMIQERGLEPEERELLGLEEDNAQGD